MSNLSFPKVIDDIKKPMIVAELLDEATSIEEFENDEFINYTRNQVKAIINKIIFEQNENYKNSQDLLFAVVDEFNDNYVNKKISAQEIMSIKEWLWQELVDLNFIEVNNKGENVIYMWILISLLVDIKEIARPLRERSDLTAIQENMIKLRIHNMIENFKSLRLLKSILEKYSERMETTKEIVTQIHRI